ncbi:hypothetical protein [Pantoea sp. BAV 3049]|uniref:hypothetical protein n=1 Tax=Pantoea sp. BAV 3049 TaxID=2654188 RepID=UPI00131B268F|nr:hypothetical protein [Pantoea sp. BAV 3049]
MMSNYALIKEGFVLNIVVWDGEGDIFEDYTTVEMSDDFPAQIGDAYINGTLYPKPRDGYDYTFDAEKLEWIITADSAKQQAVDHAQEQLRTAQSEYDRASSKIDALQDQIEDEDYSETETEEAVKAAKTTWTTYRKALRAYIAAADGTKTLPVAPDA